MRALLLLGVVCLVVFALDVTFGAQVSPWALYLVPVLAAGWLFGATAATGAAALSSTLIVLAALVSGHPFASWFDFGVAWCNRAASLLVVAWLVGIARRGAESESIRQARQID